MYFGYLSESVCFACWQAFTCISHASSGLPPSPPRWKLATKRDIQTLKGSKKYSFNMTVQQQFSSCNSFDMLHFSVGVQCNYLNLECYSPKMSTIYVLVQYLLISWYCCEGIADVFSPHWIWAGEFGPIIWFIYNGMNGVVNSAVLGEQIWTSLFRIISLCMGAGVTLTWVIHFLDTTYYMLGNDHHIPFHLVNERYIQHLCKNIQIVITDEPVHTWCYYVFYV